MQALTLKEADLYARLTLKQFGFSDYSVKWNKRPKDRSPLGRANPWGKQIELSTRLLSSVKSLEHTTKHEIAHLVQFKMMGGTYRRNGRNNFHGKEFKAACKIVGVSDARCFPQSLPLLEPKAACMVK